MELTYLDNNATTRPAREVVAVMQQYLTEFWGNPSSAHRFGQSARKGVDEARGHVARLCNCGETELFFTAGGTEATNTALRGLLTARQPRRKVITSGVEHSATRETIAQMGREGIEVVEIPVDGVGQIDMHRLDAALDESVSLVSLMWANNETGTIFPIEKIAAWCYDRRVPIHVDLTQCVGKMPIDLAATRIDCASFAAHKFHGPKGVGALYTRKNMRLRPYIVGGPQERGRRGGTENVAGIVGMGEAARLAKEHLADMPRVAAIDETRVNGDVAHRLPNTTNIGFARLQAEPILLLLSEQGVCASAGAACSSGSLEPSHVMRAMNVDSVYAHGAIRFSLSRYTTDAEVDRCMAVLPGVIEKLRRVMPVAV
jgi:cysteine desulfurase